MTAAVLHAAHRRIVAAADSRHLQFSADETVSVSSVSKIIVADQAIAVAAGYVDAELGSGRHLDVLGALRSLLAAYADSSAKDLAERFIAATEPLVGDLATMVRANGRMPATDGLFHCSIASFDRKATCVAIVQARMNATMSYSIENVHADGPPRTISLGQPADVDLLQATLPMLTDSLIGRELEHVLEKVAPRAPTVGGHATVAGPYVSRLLARTAA